MLPVIKHFPGHGDTDTDSHHTLPVIPHSRQRLDSVELYPYQHLIEAGIPAVMVSHLAVKSIDSTGIPASLSSPVIQELLRRDLNFSGLCFTDAMNMKGVTQNSQPGEAEVKALLAGNDMLLFPANLGKAVEAIKKPWPIACWTSERSMKNAGRYWKQSKNMYYRMFIRPKPRVYGHVSTLLPT